MIIGVPRELKAQEYRVGLTPASVRELTDAGHRVLVESEAGAGIGSTDADYEAAHGTIAADARDVYASADLIVKVKEPQPSECALLRPGQVLFTFLHLAADRTLAQALMASGATAIAYETVAAADGTLPLLIPMSEVAGRMAVQVGAWALQKANGGGGVLLGGVPGVMPARVLIIGGGVAGTNAAQMALGLGADVTLVDRSQERLRELAARFGNRIRTVYSTRHALEALTRTADLVIGAVLIPGAAAPRVLSREMVAAMAPGSVVIDIAIDQGGCFETSRPTTHADPLFVELGVVHYCVTNIPGAVPRTATLALNNATLPRVQALADGGWQAALARDPQLRAGLNVHGGRIAHPAVAEALGEPCAPFPADP
jgi:alanine dehydrogenase